MDSLSGINTSSPLLNIGTSSAVDPTAILLASELSLSTPSLPGNTSTVVELSGLSQLLSAVTAFQDQLGALHPGAASSGGGQNLGTDFASLAAEVQNFVDAFNGLQNSIAGINSTGIQPSSDIANSSALTLSLNTQAQASFINGNSTLTNLAQLGIEFKPSPIPDGGGSLSIDFAKLQAAFNSDPAGTFSLLSNAASSLSDLTGNFVTQADNQYSSVTALEQALATFALSGNNSLLSSTQSADNGLSTLLFLESLTGGANLQQVITAMNEYNLVSGLFG